MFGLSCEVELGTTKELLLKRLTCVYKRMIALWNSKYAYVEFALQFKNSKPGERAEITFRDAGTTHKSCASFVKTVNWTLSRPRHEYGVLHAEVDERPKPLTIDPLSGTYHIDIELLCHRL